MKRRWTSRRCCCILAIICFVTVGYRANAETSMKLPQSFYGYYVYASEKNDGLNCNKNEPTPIEQLEAASSRKSGGPYRFPNDGYGLKDTLRWDWYPRFMRNSAGLPSKDQGCCARTGVRRIMASTV